MRPQPLVQLRRAYYRACVASTPCPSCGALVGASCSDRTRTCLGCADDRCHSGCRVHLSRLHASTHARVVTPDRSRGASATAPATPEAPTE